MSFAKTKKDKEGASKKENDSHNNQSNESSDSQKNPVTPAVLHGKNLLRHGEQTTCEKDYERPTPSTATTDPLTDNSFDSSVSNWAQLNPQSTWHFSTHSDNPQLSSPAQYLPPYSAALQNFTSPDNVLPYPHLQMQSPDLQITENAYSPSVTMNTPLHEANLANVSRRTPFESQFTDLNSRSPLQNYESKNTPIDMSHTSAYNTQYHPVLPPTVLNKSNKRHFSTLSSTLNTQPKPKHSRKERKKMPSIYRHKIIFASPHEEIDASKLPKRLNLSPPPSASKSKSNDSSGYGQETKKTKTGTSGNPKYQTDDGESRK